MICPKCSGLMLYALDEEAWRCLNCGQRAGFQPVFVDEVAAGISHRGSLTHRQRVAEGMRASWAERKAHRGPGRPPKVSA